MRIFLKLVYFTLSLSAMAANINPTDTLSTDESQAIFNTPSVTDILDVQEMKESKGGFVECIQYDDGNGNLFWYPEDCPH